MQDWITNFYNGPDDDGYYCPKSWSPFTSPDIIYKPQIPAVFKSLYMRYAVKNVNSNSTSPQTFIFSLGERNSRIFRLYIPQTNAQSVGFEKFLMDDQNKQHSSRVPGKELDDPIKPEKVVELTASAQPLARTKVNYLFKVKYISKVTNRSTDASAPYDVDLQDPDPTHLLTNFGFGTFVGNCIRPDAYTFIN